MQNVLPFLFELLSQYSSKESKAPEELLLKLLAVHFKQATPFSYDRKILMAVKLMGNTFRMDKNKYFFTEQITKYEIHFQTT